MTSDTNAPVSGALGNFTDFLLRVVGAGLLIATASIHLDLYLTGYRHIPTIGVLFLLQVITAFAFALIVLVRPVAPVAASASGFVASTIGGYLLSRWVGLFGFHETPSTAGLVAGLVEAAAVIALGALAIRGLGASKLTARIPLRPAAGALGVLGIAAIALAFAGGLGSTGGAGQSTSTAASASSTAHITISNFDYDPMILTVAPGARVTVKNDDSVAHTVTSVATSGPGHFDTGNVASSATGSFTAPTKPGTYDYICSIHNFMMGVLKVS